MIPTPEGHSVPVNANTLLLQAIALRKCVAVTYNKTRMILAPHILYTRHDDVFVDAIALEREGQPPKEFKIGTFKLAGLNDIGVTDRSFQPDKIFNANDIKYEGVTLFVV
jgi:hypothetical protein